MGIASLVLGVLSLVITCFVSGYQWVAAIFGLVGIILGAVGRKNVAKKGIATAGMICSIIGFVLAIILYVACVILMASVAAM